MNSKFWVGMFFHVFSYQGESGLKSIFNPWGIRPIEYFYRNMIARFLRFYKDVSRDVIFVRYLFL